MFTIYPQYSKGRVNRAGDAARQGQLSSDDEDVIENWRASHNYVLNTFQATLRRHARENDITVAQRLKRRNTIYDKLTRQSGMQLARMHDIAGCRLIFEDIESMLATRNQIVGSRFKHIRRNKLDDYDYLKEPKDTGYRGIHDVYEYVSFTGTAEKWNGLLIELQYRTRVQHAWATAVEIVGSLTGNEAKFDRGDEDHKRFFQLASELMARHFEQMRSSQRQLTDTELKRELTHLEDKIGVLRLLESLHVSAENFKSARNLILMMKSDNTLDFFGYSKTNAALQKYFELETSERDADIVLVRSDTNEGIRSAFRNYFSDAREFTSMMRDCLEEPL